MPAIRLSRRAFLRRGGASLGSAAGLAVLLSGAVRGANRPDYGPLRPTADDSTGLELLRLPEDFSYRSFGWTGDRMDDGRLTPAAHDGMAVVATDGERLILVRNHELRRAEGAFGPATLCYDSSAGGGTTSLAFSPTRAEWLDSRVSLCGTSRNCAGGPTPWASWLSCEETLDDGESGDFRKAHGWVFEVPGSAPASGQPLEDMGRFRHEAAAVDPGSGYVYQTEDRAPGGFYRFIPRDAGRLALGGRLQMLAIRAVARMNLTAPVPVGRVFEVDWVDIDDPKRPHTPSTRDGAGVLSQGLRAGGAGFTRLEGCWHDSGRIYFTSTNGGRSGQGQVWVYEPGDETLVLLYESPGASVLNRPDNLTITPRGGLVMCEDGKAAGSDGTRMQGLRGDGSVFAFAENNVVLHGERNAWRGDFRRAEWAGATFSPDARWLFANIQTPGMTFAITGPWEQGAL